MEVIFRPQVAARSYFSLGADDLQWYGSLNCGLKEEMRKFERLLITGGAGFIGSAFLRAIFTDCRLAQVKQIYILDSLTYAGKLENIADIQADDRFVFIHGDINDVKEHFKELVTPDGIIHFAAESHVDRSITDAAPFISTNIVGTYKLLEWARENSVEIFLHVSTDEVYGSILSGSATEDSNLKPSSQYSASKASSDLIVLANSYTFKQPIIVTRCTNNYGPFQDLEKFIPTVISKAKNNKKIPIYGTGLNVRDWLYVEDHISALITILFRGEAGQIFNISGGNELSNLDVASGILQEMGKPLSLLEFVEDRKGHDLRYSLDSKKLQSQYGWKPQVDFKEGIRKTIDWYFSKLDDQKERI
jgi:dTDP-glucose 4,6-dehydratase